MRIRPRVLHVERAVQVAARKWRRRGTAAEIISLKMTVKSGNPYACSEGLKLEKRKLKLKIGMRCNLRTVSMHALIVGQMAAGGKLN